MAEIAETKTCDAFIGSGALTMPWWAVDAQSGAFELATPDGWFVELVEVDPETGERTGNMVRVDHRSIMRAVNALARTGTAKAPQHMHPDVLRECRRFLQNPDDADFDANTADQVLQYLLFGSVIYG